MPKVSVKTSKKTSLSSEAKKTATKAKTPLKSGAKKKAPVTKSKAVVTKKSTPLYSGAIKKPSKVTKKKTRKVSDEVVRKPVPITLSSIGKKLVIVESPGKVKTISKYLGSDFVVKASVGHIVDLIDRNMVKLVQKGFEPDYNVDPDKRKVVSDLRTTAKASSQVILATDEDREGEAIAFHLATQLWLDPSKTPRIVFNEITKGAILDAMDKPRKIDMAMVSAQKSRAVLDKLVGFTVSPVLWSKIKRGLSAGRVQSVAVKLVVEKEREIQAFVPVEYRVIKALIDTTEGEIEIGLQTIKGLKESANLMDASDDPKAKDKQSGGRFPKNILDSVLKQLNITKTTSTKDEKTGYEILTSKEKIEFELVDIITKQSKKSPPPPFITSSLQQTASRMFGWPVRSVMSAAQKLYEAGLITYMRTDSSNLSGTAIAQCKDFITGNYGNKYHQIRQFKSKSKNAQEAHEAIRPTNVMTTPEDIKMGQYETKLYKLIWQRTLASQMADAIFTNTQYIFHPLVNK
jgi:DNA topoisomerase-1